MSAAKDIDSKGDYILKTLLTSCAFYRKLTCGWIFAKIVSSCHFSRKSVRLIDQKFKPREKNSRW